MNYLKYEVFPYNNLHLLYYTPFINFFLPKSVQISSVYCSLILSYSNNTFIELYNYSEKLSGKKPSALRIKDFIYFFNRFGMILVLVGVASGVTRLQNINQKKGIWQLLTLTKSFTTQIFLLL